MNRFHTILFLLALLLLPANSRAQRFFNLTVQDVAIGERLPVFSHSLPLSPAYADSTYSVKILYPEFIDMTQSDIAACKALGCGELPELPDVRQQVVVDRKRGSLEVSLCPLVFREGRYRILVSFMLKVEAKAKAAAARRNASGAVAMASAASADAASRYASSSVLATGRWAKIRVPSDGVYQLTESLVRQAGFSSLAKVKVYGYGGHMQNEQLVGSELQELDDLKEVPTCTIGGRRLFYGRGPVSWSSNTASRRTRNPYSDYGYYFLTQDDGQTEPLAVDSATFVGSFYPSPYYYHTLHESDGFAWMEGGRNLFDPKAIAQEAEQKISLGGNANATRATFTVTATAAQTTQVEVTLNDSITRTMYITMPSGESGSYSKGAEQTVTLTTDVVKEDNTLAIKNIGGGSVHLDFASVAWDKPKPLPSLSQGVPVPQYVYNITNQNHHADPQADMVIIIPTSQKLLKQAQRLADFHREKDGMRVNVVPADELFNEFGSGTPDANAYRRYLKMLYDRATTDDDMPRYLVLFGDCVWDNRMLTPVCQSLSPDDFLLCQESENSYSLTDCYVDDGFFCLLDDGEGLNPTTRDKLDMAVGRFTVTTEEEAKVMVDKVVNYSANKNAGAWQNTLVFMGDDGNNNIHMRDENETADMVAGQHPDFIVKKIMWDAYERVSSATGHTYPDVARLIKQQQQQGALVMDYAGHGSETQISHERVLTLADVKAFNNTNLPLWVTASCDIMPFDGTGETLGEAAVLNSKGGAVAFYGTTRTVYTNYNKVINQAFLRHLLGYNGSAPTTLGEAQRLAKNELIDTSHDLTANKLQYALIGDPALRLAIPSKTMVIDSINGQKVSDSATIRLKAGSIATMSGHVEDGASFNGVATATVRDAEQTVTCRMNDSGEKDGAEYAFTFTAVGRFTVTTEEEAKVMVDKVVNYSANKNAGAWQNTLVFMGDDGNNNIHMRDENETADMVAGQHPDFIVKKIMWDAYERVSSATGHTYPDVARLIKQQQQQGALVMDYAGHGSETQISHERVLTLADVKAFNNTNLPLWVTASCDIMPFDGTGETLGEAAVLNSKGGAVAFYGTTRTVYTNYNKVINQAFLRHLLGYNGSAPTTLGEAQRLAKNELIDTSHDLTANKLQYALIGDPALRLAIPSKTMVIDSINGQKVSDSATIRLKAGSIATMSGHVEDGASFNGVATATVRDAEQTVTCRMNDSGEKDGAEYAFTFTDRPYTLYQGSDSIRAGRFNFRFAVTKDLTYSDKTAIVNLYGVSSDRAVTANGWCDRFVANGSDLAENDSIGPSVFCYLNSPSFTNGGRVNTTPYFVAEISDKDGINASGSGIGHDLQLVIDGDINMTYSLNDNFTYDFGSYTSGSTYYALPELSSGKHRLMFRAWDVLNNPSTTELDFTVVKGLEPNLFSVNVTNNPAVSSTTFVINHDRMGSNVDVEIELFDMSGRKLWQHSESGVSTDSAYTVDWDLTVDGGRRLQTGVYLYRARIGSDGSGMASKAKKLIIVDRQ